MINEIKNAVKVLIVGTLILDLIAAIYHCACSPIPVTIQMMIGVGVLFSMLVAPLVSESNSTVVVPE